MHMHFKCHHMCPGLLYIVIRRMISDCATELLFRCENGKVSSKALHFILLLETVSAGRRTSRYNVCLVIWH